MRMVLVAVMMAVVAMSLCGCGSARQASANKELAVIGEEINVDFTDKRLDPVRSKINFPGNKIGSPTSAPDVCPNEEEKKIINIIRGKASNAKERFIGINSKYSFSDAQVIVQYFNALDINLGRLYKCQLTFQSYAEIQQRIRNMTEIELLKIKAQVEEENRMRTQQAIASFGAALQSAGAEMQRREEIRQAIRESNRPRQTVCRKNGDKIDCTTY